MKKTEKAKAFSLNKYGFVRVAAVSTELKIADTAFNAAEIIKTLDKLAEDGCSVAVFPELCISGYTCADLFYQKTLIDAAEHAVAEICSATENNPVAFTLGIPVLENGRLYNCAAFVHEGRILGIVPKTCLPTTNEFYEKRWFASSADANFSYKDYAGQSEIPFGTDILFKFSDFKDLLIGIEICEDLWSVNPMSSEQALAGANMILNPSASNELLGKFTYRRDLVKQQSARGLCSYVYASSGPGESTTDVVYSGHCMIAENGTLLAENKRYSFESDIVIADVDVESLSMERMRNASFFAYPGKKKEFRHISFSSETPLRKAYELRRCVSQAPFVPQNKQERAANCSEIFAIQASGLAARLRHIGAKNIVLGVSGGLDSTLALLVAVKSFDILKLPHSGIHTITMPGFGTTKRTKSNAARLSELLGVGLDTVPIADAVLQHFKDIKHPVDKYDVVYENSQARERTQILMNIANQRGAIVLGTGDLSEAALGWCTFNGDHMSMYHVNAGVPKSLVKYLVEWCAESVFSGEISKILIDIFNTPITPELLPLSGGKELVQKTESTIGPYELHDFFLFNCVRKQFTPAKILFLAEQAFAGKYSREEILKWLELYYKRFFSQQFKRSSMPDGPKVGSVALSPRGDWRMPSDASAATWLAEIANLKK